MKHSAIKWNRIAPVSETKKPTILLVFCLSVIDAGLSLLPIQIIAAVVDLLSTGKSAFFSVLGTSLSLHVVFFGAVYAAKHAVSLIRPTTKHHAVKRSSNRCVTTP